MSTLDDAIQAIRMGDKEEGRQILEEILESDEGNEQVWLWLSTVVETNEDREVCLENVLALNPDNAVAQKGLDDLRSGHFNINELMSAALSGIEEEEEEPDTGATFIDEFRRASEDEEEDDEDELVMPSTMAKSKAQQKKSAAKKGGGFKLNPRLLILAVLVLLVICGLAGAAVYNLFLSAPSGEQTVQETPTDSGGTVQPTDTPIPAEATPAPPTDTPTPTRVPLELPTPRPTDPPTPTATQVVAPTP